MTVGDQVLFRYTDEILSHWESSQRDAEYQIAAFVRDILASVSAAVAPLPSRIERLASDWQLLMELRKPTDDVQSEDDLWYEAWQWLDERSPWAHYIVACPRFQFVRIGAELRIHWDNRERKVDGLPVWTAQQGFHVVSVESFLDECRELVRRLLSEMHDRIVGIETGAMIPQVQVSAGSLKEEHATWREEFASYFAEYQPDVHWQETEKALLAIAAKKGLRF